MNVIVYILVILFGIASWVDINGLWVELPILVQRLPEGWTLPSYMVIIIQLANVGPFVYTLSKLKCTHRLKEVPVIYGIIGIGASACLLLAFLWEKTSYVAGNEHSTSLLVLNFFLALVDCTSSVAFLPFMAHFKQEYITAFFIGEGFSGLLPALLALAQGVGQIDCVNQTVSQNHTVNASIIDNINETMFGIGPVYETPRFSVEAFFFFLFGMLVVCGIAFSFLNYSDFAKSEQITLKGDVSDSSNSTQSDYSAHFSSYELGRQTPNSPPDNFMDAADNIHSRTHLLDKQKRIISIQKDKSIETSQSPVVLPNSIYILYLLITMWVNGLMNGALPSIQSYSALPYGNTVYHLTVTLGSIANPLSCFFAFFISTSSVVTIVILTVIGTGFASYCILLAALSPDPFLVTSFSGSVLVVCAWFFVTFTLTYTKVSIATILRAKGKRALLWCGALTQVGSAIGAIFLFLLVNIFSVFQDASPCRA